MSRVQSLPGLPRGRFAAPLGFMFAAVLFALPDLMMWHTLGDRFVPFSVSPPVSAQTYDETQLYVPGARRFMEEGVVRTEVDVFELRDARSAYPVLHAIVMGGLGRLFGSLEAAWVVGHGLFPAMTWLLLYAIGRRHGLSPLSAASLSAVVCLVPFGPRNALLQGHFALVQPLELSRTPHPSLSFMVCLAAACATGVAVQAGRVALLVLAGLLVGINFYAYYFSWVALGLGFATWFMAALATGRHREAASLAIVGAAAVAAGSQYLLLLWHLSASGTQSELMARVGDIGRTVDALNLTLSLVIVAGLLAAYARSSFSPATNALVFLLCGGLLGQHLQLLTGYNPQHGHFLNRLIQPLSAFLVGLLLLPRVRDVRSIRLASILVLSSLVTIASYRQISVARAMTPAHDRNQPYLALIDRLAAILPPGAVVAASDRDTFTTLPALTSMWTFVPLGDRTQAAHREILTRYLIVRKLEGADRAAVHADFTTPTASQKGDRLLDYVLGLEHVYPRIIEQVDELWDGLDPARELSARRIDYLVTSAAPALPPGWQAREVALVGRWHVLKLARPNS